MKFLELNVIRDLLIKIPVLFIDKKVYHICNELIIIFVSVVVYYVKTIC